MTSTIAQHDERISLRPVVLGVCFFWGVTCGFLTNGLREPPAVVDQKPATNNNGADPKNTGLTPQGKKVKQVQESQGKFSVVKPPDPGDTPKIISPPSQDPQAPAKGLSTVYPPMPRLRLDPAYGLTGKSVRLPKMPLKVKEGPAPPKAASKNTYDDLGPPELD